MSYTNHPIRYRIDGGEIRTIPKSQWARLLRFLWLNRASFVTVLEMIEQLETSEVSARLCQLQSRRFGVLVDREPIPGSRKIRYRLNAKMEVLGEEAAQ